MVPVQKISNQSDLLYRPPTMTFVQLSPIRLFFPPCFFFAFLLLRVCYTISKGTPMAPRVFPPFALPIYAPLGSVSSMHFLPILALVFSRFSCMKSVFSSSFAPSAPRFACAAGLLNIPLPGLRDLSFLYQRSPLLRPFPFSHVQGRICVECCRFWRTYPVRPSNIWERASTALGFPFPFPSFLSVRRFAPSGREPSSFALFLFLRSAFWPDSISTSTASFLVLLFYTPVSIELSGTTSLRSPQPESHQNDLVVRYTVFRPLVSPFYPCPHNASRHGIISPPPVVAGANHLVFYSSKDFSYNLLFLFFFPSFFLVTNPYSVPFVVVLLLDHSPFLETRWLLLTNFKSVPF